MIPKFFFPTVIFILLSIPVFSQIKKQNPQIDKIDVLHYEFYIDLNDTTLTVEALAKVKLRFKKKSNEFYLDLVSLKKGKGNKVLDVQGGGGGIKYRHENDKLYFSGGNWNKGDTVQFEIKYRCTPADGLIISKNKYGKRTFFGDNWPDRAHNWLPVIDHPSDKASVDWYVKAPLHYEVVANGRFAGKTGGEKENLYHFSTGDVPLATKVMVTGVADFDIWNYDKVDCIDVYAMTFHPTPAGGQYDYLPAVEVMRYYIDSIGEYSYFKLANVQSKTRYGGMENAGNIFYYEASVNGRHKVEPLVAHEIAHQWFGNSVTEKDWHHIWLSEGFATYLTDMYLEQKYGYEKMKERMKMEREKVIRYNSVVSRPVIDTTVTDWNRLLNPNSYEKGAWVLHMLRRKTGDAIFYKILRTYYQRYKNGNALTKDFRAVAEEVSGMDLKEFFHQWLYKPGIPDLDIKWYNEGTKIYFTVKQKGDIFKFTLPVAVFDRYGHVVVYDLDIARREEVFVFDMPLNNQEIVGIEPDYNVEVLFKAAYSKAAQKPAAIPLLERSNSLIKKGDLLFQDLDCGSLCDAIENVTTGYHNASFSHVGIVSDIVDDSVTVMEAMGDTVGYVSLPEFLNRSKDMYGHPKVVVGRLKDTSLVRIALRNLPEYAGKKYDPVFDIDNDKYYCSELVYYAFEDKDGKKLFSLAPMTFKDPETGKISKTWIDYFKKYNTPVPEGKPGINPADISKSDKIKILYRFGNPQGWRDN